MNVAEVVVLVLEFYPRNIELPPFLSVSSLFKHKFQTIDSEFLSLRCINQTFHKVFSENESELINIEFILLKLQLQSSSELHYCLSKWEASFEKTVSREGEKYLTEMNENSTIEEGQSESNDDVLSIDDALNFKTVEALYHCKPFMVELHTNEKGISLHFFLYFKKCINQQRWITYKQEEEARVRENIVRLKEQNAVAFPLQLTSSILFIIFFILLLIQMVLDHHFPQYFDPYIRLGYIIVAIPLLAFVFLYYLYSFFYLIFFPCFMNRNTTKRQISSSINHAIFYTILFLCATSSIIMTVLNLSVLPFSTDIAFGSGYRVYSIPWSGVIAPLYISMSPMCLLLCASYPFYLNAIWISICLDLYKYMHWSLLFIFMYPIELFILYILVLFIVFEFVSAVKRLRNQSLARKHIESTIFHLMRSTCVVLVICAQILSSLSYFIPHYIAVIPLLICSVLASIILCVAKAKPLFRLNLIQPYKLHKMTPQESNELDSLL